MVRVLVVFLCLFVLAGCGGAPAAPDLEALILQSGDLPAAIQRGQANHETPSVYTSLGVPEADVVVYQDFDGGSNSAIAGNVTISVYSNHEQRDDAYNRIVAEFIPLNSAVEGLGEKSAVNLGRVAFTRCNALVRIVLPTEPGSAQTYAKRLDSRLQEKVC